MHGIGHAMTRRLWLLLVGACSVGCRRRVPDETPDGVVSEWLERMQRVHGDPQDAALAFDLLSTEAKRNLEERARRASAATGRKMTPESMLAPSRFSLRFTPRQMVPRVVGDRAVVSVVGSNAEVERAEVRCVREGGLWRVDLVLPPLPEIEMRPAAGRVR